jgi:site-specific DNA recombinase
MPQGGVRNDREHPHYVKGTVYCGGCGNRLVYSEHVNRHGKLYRYYRCLGRVAKLAPCTRP